MLTDDEFDTMQKEKCQAKRQFSTLSEALYNKIFADKKFNKVHKIYRCPYCGFLHLKTDKNKSPRKKMAITNNPKIYKKVRKIEKRK